jgi:hypothetical protein
VRLSPLILLPSLVSPFLTAQIANPIQIALATPRSLDLRDADVSVLVPKDNRNAAQIEEVRLRWVEKVAAYRQEPSLRLMLPRGEGRVTLLLAASQALRAQNANQKLYVAFDADAPPILDESAWGAVDGGMLSAEDLGKDVSTWRDRLAQAQGTFPGRPWFLWLPQDPGAQLSILMGDGGRVIVPTGGPAAKLAEKAPPTYTDVEGGLGDLTLRNRSTRTSLRWRFENGEWKEAALPRSQNEVTVNAADSYDVGALLAKVRASQLRGRAALRTFEAKVDLDLHIQARRDGGGDLGFRFSAFERAGESVELLQEQILFNGVKAKIAGEVQFPIVESRRSLSLPLNLSLNERYRYSDGGAEGEGKRVLRFEPVDKDALLFRGELVVQESTGLVLEERRERSNLPGVIKSERETLTYGQIGEGIWRPVDVKTFERWTTSDGVVQVQRHFRYRDIVLNDAGFDARRDAARTSKQTMLKETPDGVRYFTRQGDGTRKLDEHAKSSGRAFGGFLLILPGEKLPVVPAAGLAYFNFNAFNKGIQVNAITAIVFNRVSIAIPHSIGGLDFSASATTLLLPVDEQPVKNGKLVKADGVSRQFGVLTTEVGRELGAGFRLEAKGLFSYNRYGQAQDKDIRTPGFALPPSGLTRELRAETSWLWRGFQITGYYGSGQQPKGTYGVPTNPQVIPDEGKFRRWGGDMNLDREVKTGVHAFLQGGYDGGKGFDRFNNLSVSGLGGNARVSGIRSNAIIADQLVFAKAGFNLPSGPNLRLSFTLDHARARALDDQKTYRFTGLGMVGDLPGFWWFTAVRVDLGVGLQSDIKGVKTVNGFITFLRFF